MSHPGGMEAEEFDNDDDDDGMSNNDDNGQGYLGGPTPRGSQQHKIGFLTYRTTHSAKISFLKVQ